MLEGVLVTMLAVICLICGAMFGFAASRDAVMTGCEKVGAVVIEGKIYKCSLETREQQ